MIEYTSIGATFEVSFREGVEIVDDFVEADGYCFMNGSLCFFQGVKKKLVVMYAPNVWIRVKEIYETEE